MHKDTKVGPIKKLLILSTNPLLSIWKRLKELLYDFSVNIHKKRSSKIKVSNMSTKNRNRLIFYIAVVSLPVLQFIIFYIFVNINSILLAFQKMEYFKGGYVFVGFENFTDVLRDIKTLPRLQASLRNSLKLFMFTFGVGVTLSLMFSYYIFKKFLFSGFFKVILFLPQIIPSIVLVTIYKYFTENAVPQIYELLTGKYMLGLLSDTDTEFVTVLFYTIWAGFGTQILMYSGAMSGISVSVIESAKLDGCNPLREFWSIIVPLIYPTIVTFIVVAIAGIFTHQMHLFSFFGSEVSSDIYTFGYYLYKTIKSNVNTISIYPYLAAMGLILTLVSAPTTLLAKWLLEKLGPSAD